MSPNRSNPDPAEPRNPDAPPRKNPPPTAQDLRLSPDVKAPIEDEKPCDRGECGLGGPWYCGCLCVHPNGPSAGRGENDPAEAA